MVKLLQYWLTMKHIARTALIFLLTAFALTPCKVLAMSAERWEAINQHAEDLKRQDAYRPKAGDNCFVSEDDVAWLTPAAKSAWQKKYTAEYFRMGGKFDFPDQSFKKATVAASNGSLIFLEKGTKVKVLDGRPAREGYGFEGLNGKIEVLTGPKDGLTCFCDGGSLKDTVVESNETFFRTEEERKANQSLFVSEQLNKPIADVLAINGVRIDAPVPSVIKAAATPNNLNGTMPRSWQPSIRCLLGEVPIPFGKKLVEFPAYLSRLRITVEEAGQNRDVRTWVAPNSLMVIPGWGFARSYSLDFTEESGTWVLKQVRTIRSFQMNPNFKMMKFKQAVSTLSQCFGRPELENGKAIWDRGSFYMTLFSAEDDSEMGYQKQFALILCFTQK